MFQKVEVNNQMIYYLKALKVFLVNYHCDKGFRNVLIDTKELANKLEIKACFPILLMQKGPGKLFPPLLGFGCFSTITRRRGFTLEKYYKLFGFLVYL